jgi:hypothetical protein
MHSPFEVMASKPITFSRAALATTGPPPLSEELRQLIAESGVASLQELIGENGPAAMQAMIEEYWDIK